MPRRSTINSLIKKAIENGVNINENKINNEEIAEILKTFYKTDSLLNKESVLSKTESLKQTFSKTLKTNLEKIVYFIKDSNFTGFKSLYEKFCNNPDIIDKNGDSLLNLAVQANNFQIVDFLLNEGADPNISNVRIYLIFILYI
jgi:ankyrin repeat protein